MDKFQKHYNLNINLTAMAVVLYVFYFSIKESFLLPYILEILILIFSIFIVVFNKLIINRSGMFITRIDIMWFLFLFYFINNLIFKSLVTGETIFDILVYFSGIVFLLFMKVDVDVYNSPVKLIKIHGIIYACSAIFQYLFTEVYISNILPLFSVTEQERILRLLRDNSYAGFTHQTAYLAGYIVTAIGAFLFFGWKNMKRHHITFRITLLLVMFLGLLLTAKRAHLIFLLVAVVLTILLSISNRRIIKKLIQISLASFFVIALAILFYNSFNFNENSPIEEFIYELDETFTAILRGEDVTSGRITLYKHAIDLFINSPITGIGWKEFINSSVGLINSNVGSHPHNIYLQLLTELGVIGFMLFIIPVLSLFLHTIRVLRVLSNADLYNEKLKYGMQFSFFLQSFFILYGLTGNTITDYSFLLTYFLACSISLSVSYTINRHKLQQRMVT